MQDADLELPSGLLILKPVQRLLQFSREEFAYYDGIEYSDPDRIEPLDVLATVSVNSFVNSAPSVRQVHRGLEETCRILLPRISKDADLCDEGWPSHELAELLHAAVQPRGILVPVATKVLHRKRRHLIPMLDNVVLKYYLDRSPELGTLGQMQLKAKAAEIAMRVLDVFRTDLLAVRERLRKVQASIAAEGFTLSLVRLLEILLWTAVESRGYYRAK